MSERTFYIPRRFRFDDEPLEGIETQLDDTFGELSDSIDEAAEVWFSHSGSGKSSCRIIEITVKDCGEFTFPEYMENIKPSEEL